jgi:glycosyltransferase involved in cell wall biosynthesis
MGEKISIIIPVYNTAQYIEKCIDSLCNQTYKNLELILVDDGSNIETKNKLKELSSKIDIIIHQENYGQSFARNLGIKIAKGDFIIFVDSDDYVEVDFCKKLIQNYTENTSVVTCSSNIIIEGIITSVFVPIGGNIKNAIKNNIALGTSLFVKQDLIAIGGYDESMRKGFEDWEMLIRLLNYTGKQVSVVKEPLYNYRKGIESTTIRANKIKYDLLKYIYQKNEEIYKQYFNDFIAFLLLRIEKEEKEKLKIYTRLEYKIGFYLLKPFRFVKRILHV